MFKNKSNRYITRGVNGEVDIRLQLLMWSIIDNLNEKGTVKVDYLQVFEFKRNGSDDLETYIRRAKIKRYDYKA